MPVIMAVSNPRNSGLFLFKVELQKIKINAIIISQLPTVSPTFMESPTNRASKGDVPRPDNIVNEMPKIGRASCRERVKVTVGAGTGKGKRKEAQIGTTQVKDSK